MQDDTNKTQQDEAIFEEAHTESAQHEEVEEQDPLAEKLEELENKYRRALADYQNLEKRTRDARRELIESANRDLLLRLLPVLDTLLLAQEHVEDEGLRVSIQQFLDVIKSEGILRIETEGKSFDPSIMECVIIEPGKEGKVIAEIRAGYILHDKLLRPAQVKVGSGEK